MDSKVDIERFLKKIDSYFNKNDLDGAGYCLKFWESEARKSSDDRALLTILNEYLGFCRRVNDKEKAISSISECKSLIDKLCISKTIRNIFRNSTCISFCKWTLRIRDYYQCNQKYQVKN